MSGGLADAWSPDDRALVAALWRFHELLLSASDELLFRLWRSAPRPVGTDRVCEDIRAAGPQCLTPPERLAMLAELSAEIRALWDLAADLERLQTFVNTGR